MTNHPRFRVRNSTRAGEYFCHVISSQTFYNIVIWELTIIKVTVWQLCVWTWHSGPLLKSEKKTPMQSRYSSKVFFCDNKRKWNGKKATTKTITTQEIWHWHWIVSKKRTKHFYFIQNKCWKCCPWCVTHACALRAIDARTLEKNSRSYRIWTPAATTRPVSSSIEFTCIVFI
jgi:hypothetical protein